MNSPRVHSIARIYRSSEPTPSKSSDNLRLKRSSQENIRSDTLYNKYAVAPVDRNV